MKLITGLTLMLIAVLAPLSAYANRTDEVQPSRPAFSTRSVMNVTASEPGQLNLDVRRGTASPCGSAGTHSWSTSPTPLASPRATACAPGRCPRARRRVLHPGGEKPHEMRRLALQADELSLNRTARRDPLAYRGQDREIGIWSTGLSAPIERD
jgi:hypothetical protein